MSSACEVEKQAAGCGIAPVPGARLAVLTHHKCASSFVGHYLEVALRLNGLCLFRSHLGTDLPSPVHHVSFLQNAVYDRLKDHLAGPAIHVVRNPLDLIVSAYYSHCSTHSTGSWPQLTRQRRALQFVDPAEGFFLTLAFLEREDFYDGTPGPLHALRTWRYDDAQIPTARMEDLVRDVGGVLGATLTEALGTRLLLPDPEEFTFQRITGGRYPGQVDETSHYRSGASGQWRSKLPQAIVAYVRAHFEPLLERFYPEALR
jgi:hypothetical protein